MAVQTGKAVQGDKVILQNIVELTSQKRLLSDDVAASFGGFGTGAILGGKGGCGWVSEEVGSLNAMFGLRLYSMTFSISVWMKLVVCGLYIFLTIHCFDFLQKTCLTRGSPMNYKDYNDYTDI